MNSLLILNPSKGHKEHSQSHSEEKAIAQNVKLRYTDELSTAVEFNCRSFIYQYSNTHRKIYSTSANTFIMAIHHTLKYVKVLLTQQQNLKTTSCENIELKLAQLYDRAFKQLGQNNICPMQRTHLQTLCQLRFAVSDSRRLLFAIVILS